MNERINYKYLENDLAVEEEIVNIFNSNDIYDENVISLYDVLNTIQIANKRYELVQEEYQDYFEYLLRKKYANPFIKNLKANGQKREITMDFKPEEYQPFKSVTFAEGKSGIYIKKDENGCGREIYRILNKEIINCYMDLLSCSSFLKERKEGIRPLNSNFFVNMDKFGVFLSNNKSFFTDCFKFYAYSGFGLYKAGEYDHSPKLSNAFGTIKDNEKELLEKIFIEIKDCPEWSKETLYKRRDKQLNPGLLKSKILKLKKAFK